MTARISIALSMIAIFAMAALIVNLDLKHKKEITTLDRRLRMLEERLDGPDASADAAMAGHTDRDPGSAGANDPDMPDNGTMPPTVSGGVNQAVMARLQNVEESVAATDEVLADTIEEHVADVVEVKVSELEERQKIKQSEDPTFTDFAMVLNLNEGQRDAAHSSIHAGQVLTREILDIPTKDGGGSRCRARGGGSP